MISNQSPFKSKGANKGFRKLALSTYNLNLGVQSMRNTLSSQTFPPPKYCSSKEGLI